MHGLANPKFTETVGIECENELRGPFGAKNHRQRPVCCCRCYDCGRTSRWLVVDVEAVLVVGTLPKFGSTLFRNVGDTARFYTGSHLQKRTALASDVITRSFIKWELSAVYKMGIVCCIQNWNYLLYTRTWICWLIRVLALFASK